ncbi:FtsX-like permease family protein [Thermomonospora umbrina]|uniref:Putative ABC transport system permease protein n=1 Tax=Thermomonospora umbrina TaxID=111806 RepID=A0A3D9T597_9ACTN|nr:FtsX-like permease family protein [Thermomonospora umbrina]REE98971.1 putative ABC transport system permease protein [Thermomonospora umbrina]
MNLGGHRVAFRIARRDALRAKGRSILVLCMIAVPVTAIVALGVFYNTGEWSARERLPHDLGHADARLISIGHGPIEQDATGEVITSGDDPGGAGERRTTAEIAPLVTGRFGPDARVLVRETSGVQVQTSRGYLRVDTRGVDLRDPIAEGMLDVTAGRPPATAGEVAVSSGLRDQGFPIGGTVRTRSGHTLTVVGHVADPLSRRDEAILQVLPGTGIAAESTTTLGWLIDAGRPVTWQDVRALNRFGLVVTSAEVVRHPPAEAPSATDGGSSAATVAVFAMAISMIVLEVVLLAGPAFAVGLRRQRRLLALVRAAGGDASHLRGIVLAGGAVIGAAAAVLGAVAGLGLAALASEVVHRATDRSFGPYDVRWPLVAAPMALGALSGLLAAYVPARQAARMDVVAALAGRREPFRERRGWPLVGACVVAVGVALSVIGVRQWREFGAAFGAVAIVIGCVMLAPWLVGLTGRAAGRLPLPLRLAVRDNARNRARSGPAVAAIMAAVAGVTTLAIGGASDFSQRRIEYRPTLPEGSAMLRSHPDHDTRIRAALVRELPGVPVREARSLTPPDDCAERRRACTLLELVPGGASRDRSLQDRTLVGGPDVLRLLLGRDDPRAAAALRAGSVVLLGGERSDGPMRAAILKSDGADGQGGLRTRTVRTVRLPALTLPDHVDHGSALLSPETAARLGVPTSYGFHAVDRVDHRITVAEQRRIDERVTAALPEDSVDGLYVERGFTESFATPLLALALAGGVLVFGGSLIVTGLSAADARPDLTTLAAVGARPRTRRLLAMGQAGVVALLGCWLGIAAGLVPGVSVAYPLTVDGAAAPPAGVGAVPAHGLVLDIPWSLLTAVGLGVPLLVAVTAGLLTRSGPIAARRSV